VSPLLAAISPASWDLESGLDIFARLSSLLSQWSAMFGMDRRHPAARGLIKSVCRIGARRKFRVGAGQI
jgi:hypothetical protein